MENKKIEEQIKSAIYVTVGAAQSMLEKTKELITQFEEIGKKTCEAHQIDNEELKHNIQEAIKKVVTVTIEKDETTESFVEKMDQLSEEDLAKIKAKLAELEAKEQTSEETKE